MIDYLQQIDSDVLLFFNSCHSVFFDNFFFLFSGKFIWIPMYVAILMAFIRRFNVRQLVFLLLGLALAITLADQLCASVIRPIFERLRPANLENPLSQFVHIVNGYRGGRYGFPSCHASNSFALAMFTALAFRRRSYTLFIFAWAIINCYSRIYLGVHYPGDILTGAVIGCLLAWGCYLLACFLTNYSFKQITPNGDFKLYKQITVYNITQLIAILTIIFIILSSIFHS